MRKKLISALAVVACSTLTTMAAADVAPGPSCKCETPGASSTRATPLVNGAAAMVVVMGAAVMVIRRKRNR